MCDINIGMYETGKAKFPNSLGSGSMGPCITVGIFDKKKKRGYMRHQPGPEHGTDMEDFIKEVLSESNKSDLIVYACGGSASEDEDFPDETTESKEYIKKLLLVYFEKKQITTKWAPKDKASELRLNTIKGKFTFIIEDD